jgi:hypothetical protein
MLPLIIAGAFLLIEVIALICFFIVLIKLFKNEGALKGIFGFFCGIYTFIWGWMKHRELQMTKVMGTWTLLILIALVVPAVLAFTMPTMLQDVPFVDDNVKKQLGIPSGKDTQQSKKTIKKRTTTKKVNVAKKKRIVTKKGPSSGNQLNQAVALWKGGKYTNPQKALEHLNKEISGKKPSAMAYNNRGLAYKDLGQFQKAIADYNQAIRLNPKYAQAYNNRGIAYYETGQFQRAVDDYNKSVMYKPDYSNAYLNRGLAYYQLKNNAMACRDFQKACDLGDCDGMNWALKNKTCK